jgi:hypothetical protein
LNGWNRLFLVVAVCWLEIVPYLIMHSANGPVTSEFEVCSDRAYRIYGTAASPQLDMNRYHLEMDKCRRELERLIGIDTVIASWIGKGPPNLWLSSAFLFAIPLSILWVVGWIVGRTFRRKQIR